MKRRVGGLLLAVVALSACAKKSSQQEPPCTCGPDTPIVDASLLAFLSQARSAHHVADAQEAAGDRAAALQALRRVTQSAKPPGNSPEVEEVLADTRARLADLLSQIGQFDEADAALTAGLENATGPSYFRGHLFEVRGAVEERREKSLREQGRGQEAERARERSLRAYEEAMRIQAHVIQETLENSARRSAPAPSSSR